MKRIASIAAAVVALALGAAATAQAQQAQAAPDAAALWARNCASCHGTAGVPNPAMVRSMGAIPDFSDAHTVAGLADSTMVNVITNGKGRTMPAYRTRLTPEQVRALVTYVKSLSHH